MAKSKDGFSWLFHRMGGLDQVEFKSGEDIRRLRELDPKLWVALSCPSSGLEFDARTLSLVDTDKDGRIRIPEVVAAAEWTCARLKNLDALLNPGETMPLAAIDETSPEGGRLLTTAKAVLANLGKAGAESVSPEDATQAVLHASEQAFNGDGILPPLAELDEDMRAFIQDALQLTGGVQDASGETGVNTAIVEAFLTSLRQWRDWSELVAHAETRLGAATPELWELATELKDKIDDYFMRCELAAYAPSAQNSLNLEDRALTDDTGLLELHALAELPLSKAAPDQPLDLARGLNPAWRGKVERLAELARPLLASADTMTRTDWRTLWDALAPFAAAVKDKPKPIAVPEITTQPTLTLEQLGAERIDSILSGNFGERFAELARQDAEGPATSRDVEDLERLVHYYLNLHRLLVNFVNFKEFYDLDSKASFQSGRLYIDGRACSLCSPADNPETHSAIAADSGIFLLYCECGRGGKDGVPGPEKKMNIVAAVTAGDSDLLTANRNGVYVDNNGDDWDARVVKVISNPIGVWQAVWSPYKKIGSLITDQIGKYASEKQAGLMATAGKKLNEAGSQAAAGTPPRFDIGRNVGIFAAVGLALGAIGTAVGSIASALLSMEWWQLPLLLAGIFIVISGPSVLIAWMKLRRRTLGPLLEASGWAINGRANLDYAVAKRLSSLATMPPNSHRSEYDPVFRMKRLRRSVFGFAVLVGALAVFGWLFLKDRRHAEEAAKATPPAAAAAAPEKSVDAAEPAPDAEKKPEQETVAETEADKTPPKE